MLNNGGIRTETFGNVNQILVAPSSLQFAVGIVVDDTGVTADSRGKKIIKAGTPVAGDLMNRTEPFQKAATGVEGVLVHDVDVTVGEANASLLLFGFVNVSRLDDETKALITDGVKEELNMIKFIAD